VFRSQGQCYSDDEKKEKMNEWVQQVRDTNVFSGHEEASPVYKTNLDDPVLVTTGLRQRLITTFLVPDKISEMEYKVYQYDDDSATGFDPYLDWIAEHPNRWYINERTIDLPEGKVALTNVITNVEIRSISRWKTIELDYCLKRAQQEIKRARLERSAKKKKRIPRRNCGKAAMRLDFG